MEKLLPQNIEAECGVLGSIIIDPEAIVQVSDFLYSGDFYRDTHRTIYEVILALFEQRKPADFITICDELERQNKLEEVGGPSYITSLINQVPTSGNVEYYGHIVERTAILRRLIHAAGQIAAIAYESNDAPAAVQKAEQLIFAVSKSAIASGFLSLEDIIAEYMQELVQVHEKRGAIIGIPTGFTGLDKLLGGLQRADLIVLAGRPSMGKSSAGMGIAYYGAGLGYRVAVFSLEMGRRQLALLLMAIESGLSMQNLRNGWIDDTNGEWDRIVGAEGTLSDLPIWINDTTGNPILSMRSQLRRLVSEQGSIDLVVVDYLQLIEPPEDEDHRHHANRVNEIGEITRGLKGIAKEFDVPVLALAQLSRAVETRQSKIPQLSDLRESGSIENDADVVMMIYRQDYYDQREGRERTRQNEADIIVEKHRQGPIGTVTLQFQPERARFSNMPSKQLGSGQERNEK